MKNTKVITVINQKGGVGKTTTTLNFSYALSQTNKKILLIDADPQGHLGNSFGVNHVPSGLDEVLLNADDMQTLIQNIRPKIDILVAGQRLGEMETKVSSGVDRGYRLKEALISLNNKLVELNQGYDYIVIDCPPSAGLLGMNAILAADEMIIPVTGDYLALQGLSRLVQVLKTIEQRLGQKTKKWFILTRFHQRRKLANEIKNKLIQYFPKQVLKTNIRESVALAESPGFGKTIFEYQAKSHGSEDYRNMVNDYLNERTF